MYPSISIISYKGIYMNLAFPGWLEAGFTGEGKAFPLSK